MKIKKFLDKKTSKKVKISILEKMLKQCEAGGGTLPVEKAKQIITAYIPEKLKWVEELKAQWFWLITGAGSWPMDIKKKRQAASAKQQAWQERITMLLYPIN